VSEATVLDVRDRTAAAATAIARGILQPPTTREFRADC
jgi:hypothetical protein